MPAPARLQVTGGLQVLAVIGLIASAAVGIAQCSRRWLLPGWYWL